MSKYWWIPFVLSMLFLVITCTLGIIMIHYNLIWELLWLIPFYAVLCGIVVIVANKIFLNYEK